MEIRNLITIAVVILGFTALTASCEMKRSHDKASIRVAALNNKCSQKLVKTDGYTPEIIWTCNQEQL